MSKSERLKAYREMHKDLQEFLFTKYDSKQDEAIAFYSFLGLYIIDLEYLIKSEERND